MKGGGMKGEGVKGRNKGGVIRQLAAFARPMAGVMAMAVLFGSAGHICAISLPVLGAYALVSVLEGGGASMQGLGGLAAALLACAALRGIFRYAEQLCNHYIAFKLLAGIRDKVFAALRRLCPAKLEGREKGDLIALITGDIELLEVFYAHTISPVAIAALVSALSAVFIGGFHPLLGAAAALSYALVGALIPFAASLSGRDSASRLREASGRLSSHYLDSLRGIFEILGMGRGEERKAEIGRMSDEAEALQRPIRRKDGAVSAVSGLAVTLCSLSVLALGLALFRSGETGFGGALMPFVALFSSFGPALAVSGLSASLPLTLAAGRRVLALLDEEPETEEVTEGLRPAFSSAECAGLTFGYGDGGDVLRGVSASFPRGGIRGVTGRSGSGKSTLLRLLMRFWAPPPGTVSISGEDINGIDTAHLRALEGFMTQETDIFSDTVENNIRTGKPGAGRGEVIDAARKAALHDFVMTLPEGYDTRIGGGGASAGAGLSGGERQRIGLARAFLHDAPFLLLDEPTSNLDSLNEGAILKALREEGAGRAVALVSHRKSTMGIADFVYSVESGRIS
ncbi:MAG: ABC transporter ATP-binding protein/permease [Clostridiales Family XIII bacterium]|jgi:ATP-binding cassette subfamily C protein|nr:ABC transporter ATP-binding protein/permease [Clostridiales Family XIII bacterium]